MPAIAAIVGSGLVGRAWAMVFARAGWQVRLFDRDASQVDAALGLIAASLAELSAMRDAADAAIQRVMDLCARWDQMTKGEGPTTAQIRAAILGLDEGTNETVGAGMILDASP